jgi:hypothetical protein
MASSRKNSLSGGWMFKRHQKKGVSVGEDTKIAAETDVRSGFGIIWILS